MFWCYYHHETVYSVIQISMLCVSTSCVPEYYETSFHWEVIDSCYKDNGIICGQNCPFPGNYKSLWKINLSLSHSLFTCWIILMVVIYMRQGLSHNDSILSDSVGQILRASHLTVSATLAWLNNGGNELGASCLAQWRRLEHGESRVVWAGGRVQLEAPRVWWQKKSWCFHYSQ